MPGKSQCEYCMYYDYNEEYECYECAMNLDEDESYQFLSHASGSCMYFRYGNEYQVVKKQM